MEQMKRNRKEGGEDVYLERGMRESEGGERRATKEGG
jgi:hypothetical protein